MQVYKILKRAIEKQMYTKEKLQQMLSYLNGKIEKYDEVLMKTEKELRYEV